MNWVNVLPTGMTQPIGGAKSWGELILQGHPKKNWATRPQERPSRWFGSLNFETIASDLANLKPYFGQPTLRIKHSQSTHIRNFL
jgi:hypothetical protein